jgi:hypothetical protein
MSQITDFFISNGLDNRGRSLKQMQAYSFGEMEAVHDFIQWAYPLHEKSLHSIDAPVLTKSDIETLRSSEVAKEGILKNVKAFKEFLGLGEKRDEMRIAFWCRKGNHNLLRITRIIKSLRLFGLESEANKFYHEVLAESKRMCLSVTTIEYWNKAISEPLP